MTDKQSAATEFYVGEPVTWYHEQRGGYGYVERIPAVVWKLGAQRVLLLLRLATWVARALGYPRDPRPGYLNLTPPAQAPPRAGKEHA